MPMPMGGSDPYTTVRISDKVTSDVRRVTFLSGTMTVADLKVRMSSILKIPVATMILEEEDNGDVLPDWTNLPSSVLLTVVAQHSYIKLDVRVPERQLNFTIQTDGVVQREFIDQYLSAILNVPIPSLVITNIKGMSWMSSKDPHDRILIVRTVERGDTQRSRSQQRCISLTEPYQNQEEEEDGASEEVQEMIWRDQVEGADDGRGPPSPMPRREHIHDYTPRRERSRSRTMSPTTSLGRGSASPTRHGHWVNASSTLVTLAQHEPILERVELPVGYIWADPNARASEVMRSMRSHMYIYLEMHVRPEEAVLWKDVRTITFENRPRVRVAPFIDMRIDRWELFQKVCPIPVMFNGCVETYMIVPSRLTISFVQYRIDLWASTRHMYTVQAIDSETWVVSKRELPERFMRALHALDEITRDILQRAGMVIRYAYAHQCEVVYKNYAYDQEVVAELVVYLSDKMTLTQMTSSSQQMSTCQT